MFQNLSDRLGQVFKRLTGKGFLTEEDVNAAMREVRIALLEADVALPVVKSFVEKVKERAVGQEVVRSVSPGQMVVKIVHDALIELLTPTADEPAFSLDGPPPQVLLMVGLQGSGKTTTTGKLALRLRTKDKKKVLLASLDVQRPAAQQQLEILARQAEVGSLPIVPGEKPEKITERALKMARQEGYDVLILDTAGRLHVDTELMDELKRIHTLAKPRQTLLVADSLTGQDAVNIAREFQAQVPLTGIVLTRVDGDARGGAALSMREITGRPIHFLGVGEKMTEIEPFQAERVAGRILDMGDIVSLVERASEVVSQEEAEKMAKKFEKGQFDLDDLADQLKNMRKMGGISSMMGLLPGMGALKDKLGDAKVDDKMILRQEAIIRSMTKAERKNPDILNASRKRRIATGSGVQVQDVNRLLKQYLGIRDMMRTLKKMGPKGMMRQMAQLQKRGGI